MKKWLDPFRNPAFWGLKKFPKKDFGLMGKPYSHEPKPPYTNAFEPIRPWIGPSIKWWDAFKPPYKSSLFFDDSKYRERVRQQDETQRVKETLGSIVDILDSSGLIL